MDYASSIKIIVMLATIKYMASIGLDAATLLHQQPALAAAAAKLDSLSIR